MAVAYLRQGDDSGSTDIALLESMKSDVLCARYGPLLRVARNLVLAAATGKLCRFWSGRRGSAKLFCNDKLASNPSGVDLPTRSRFRGQGWTRLAGTRSKRA